MYNTHPKFNPPFSVECQMNLRCARAVYTHTRIALNIALDQLERHTMTHPNNCVQSVSLHSLFLYGVCVLITLYIYIQGQNAEQIPKILVYININSLKARKYFSFLGYMYCTYMHTQHILKRFIYLNFGMREIMIMWR